MTKKVINRKVYDTKKGTLLHEWCNGLGYRDFSHCAESLYKTSTGAYFLVGNGGPQSKYSRSIGLNQWSGDSDVFTPLSQTEAIEWAENHDMPTSAILSEFGSLISEA